MCAGRLLLVSLLVLLAGAAAPARAQVPCVPPVCQPAPPPEEDRPPQDPPPEQERRPERPPPLPVAGPEPVVEGSATDRVDMGRTGAFRATDLVPPLSRRWSALLPGPVIGAPLTARGVTVVQSGRFLFGLDTASGRERWRASTLASAIAIVEGRVVAAGERGVEAFDPATGRRLWQQPAGSAGDRFVAAGGVVYAGRPLALEDGRVLRDDERRAGGQALDDRRLYGSDPCGSAATDRATLERAWVHSLGCSTGSDGWTAVRDGRVAVLESAYTRRGAGASDVLVLRQAAGGAEQAAWPAVGRPVLLDDLVVSEFADLEGHRYDGSLLWRAKAPKIDDDRTSLRWSVDPVGVGSTVFDVSIDGALFALDSRTGRVQWSEVAAANDSGYDSASVTRGQLGVAEGMLLVPGGRLVSAYANAFRPPPRGIDAGPASTDVLYDEPASIAGLVGTELRAARPTIAVQRRDWGRRRLARAGGVQAGPDGFFGFTIRTPRTTRYRLSIPGAPARAFTVYAYPRFRLTSRSTSATRAVTTVSVRHPRTARLRGRDAVLYLLRARARRLDRIGSAALRGPAGRSRARIGFGRLPRVGSEDALVACVRGQARLGLGRPTDPLVRRCGARRISLR